MELEIDKRYLVIPINEHAKPKKIKFYENGQFVYDLDIRTDYTHADYYAYYDMRLFLGKTLQIEAEPETMLAFSTSDKACEDGVYEEVYRPDFHFTTKRGWINDPNGLVYYQGKYHLFYQYNPVGCHWGNMHWGHAVSEDIVHWEEKEIALFPDRFGTMFSGSAIVDEKNLLGVQTGLSKTIVLFYTAAGCTSKLSSSAEFTQCIAYSVDGGETFEKHKGNPIMENSENGNRDPKVIYHEESGQYVMVLYLIQNRFAIYGSKNLVDWTFLQELEIEGEAECPDFYPLALDGDSGKKKWVFIGASDRYIVGEFDGFHFIAETKCKRLQYGGFCYAAQSYSDVPNGRKIRFGWFRYDIPGMSFNQAMTVPGELTLKTTGDGVTLVINPVEELKKLRVKSDIYEPFSMMQNTSITLSGKSYDISFELHHKESGIIKVELLGFALEIDTKKKLVKAGEVEIPLKESSAVTNVRILADKTAMEVFVNNGTGYAAVGNLADYSLNYLAFEADTTARVAQLEIHELSRIHRTEVCK